MGTLVSASDHKKYLVCLNISFVLVVSAFFILYCISSESLVLGSTYVNPFRMSNQDGCEALEKLDDYGAKCLYLKSNNSCTSQGYVDYLYLLYCNCGKFPILGYVLLFVWLLVLFYLLGNTASEYFCSSLESLSRLLNLSPTLAGVTLLPLGNGAPDVFAVVVSFMGSGSSDIGLSTVLGGSSFVSCVVVGIISICLHRRDIRIEKYAFVRDVCFFLMLLASLVLVLTRGEINLWEAIGFSSMYVVYVIIVYITTVYFDKVIREESVRDSDSSNDRDLSVPLLRGTEVKIESDCLEEGTLESESSAEVKKCCFCLGSSPCCSTFISILEMPLYLTRRLTIPVVCEKRWSKTIAMMSVTLAPTFLSAVWNPYSKGDGTHDLSPIVYTIGLLIGILFGVLVCMTTEKSGPPKTCLFPWLAAEFLMSVTWSYITAQELVALLVSLGYIFGISPSILGLTVLAWGNSIGDLITNLAMALKGGAQGAQIAISGCYAGPIFNIIFGLGLSLVGSCWYNYPSPVLIPKDSYLLETLGLLVCGLIWAIVILPRRGMKLDRILGGGLLFIYLVSLSLRLIQTLGCFQLYLEN